MIATPEKKTSLSQLFESCSNKLKVTSGSKYCRNYFSIENSSTYNVSKFWMTMLVLGRARPWCVRRAAPLFFLQRISHHCTGDSYDVPRRNAGRSQIYYTLGNNIKDILLTTDIYCIFIIGSL